MDEEEIQAIRRQGSAARSASVIARMSKDLATDFGVPPDQATARGRVSKPSPLTFPSAHRNFTKQAKSYFYEGESP